MQSKNSALRVSALSLASAIIFGLWTALVLCLYFGQFHNYFRAAWERFGW